MRVLAAHTTCWLRRDGSGKRTRSSHLKLLCLAKYLEPNPTRDRGSLTQLQFVYGAWLQRLVLK